MEDAAHSRVSARSRGYATVAYTAVSGASMWVKRYNGPASGTDVARAIVVSPISQIVFVTGDSTGSSTGSDLATVAYDALSGARLWLKRYDGPSHNFDGGRAIAMSPNGTKVFVVGFEDARALGKGLDFVTIAYSAQ